MTQNNFLILGFKNAKQFKPKKYKDKVVDLNGVRDRDESYFFEEPITKFQVSNLLHVIFGERPSPSLRETLIPRIEYFFKKAENSYLRLDSLKIKNKKGEENFIYETMQTRKALWNSWNPNVIVYWEKIYNVLTDEEIKTLEELFNSEFKIKPKEKPLKYWVNYLREINNEKIKNFFLNLKGKKYIYNYIFFDGTDIQQTIKRTVLFGKEPVTKHHGEIIIPINNDDLKKISKSTATILDGGFVWIKGIYNENQIDWEGFKKMTEINSEKTNLKQYYENKNKSKQEHS